MRYICDETRYARIKRVIERYPKPAWHRWIRRHKSNRIIALLGSWYYSPAICAAIRLTLCCG